VFYRVIRLHTLWREAERGLIQVEKLMLIF
jgi:hypothetical protein